MLSEMHVENLALFVRALSPQSRSKDQCIVRVKQAISFTLFDRAKVKLGEGTPLRLTRFRKLSLTRYPSARGFPDLKMTQCHCQYGGPLLVSPLKSVPSSYNTVQLTVSSFSPHLPSLMTSCYFLLHLSTLVCSGPCLLPWCSNSHNSTR